MWNHKVQLWKHKVQLWKHKVQLWKHKVQLWKHKLHAVTMYDWKHLQNGGCNCKMQVAPLALLAGRATMRSSHL